MGLPRDRRFSSRAAMPPTNSDMKITRHLRVWFTLAVLGCAASGPTLLGQAPTPIQASPSGTKSKSIPALKIRNGPLAAAVEELSRAMEMAHLPEMNVIYASGAQTIQVPDLVLRNVNGPDALRLITASAGCEMEPILGSDGQSIGFRVFPPPPPPSMQGILGGPELGGPAPFADPSSVGPATGPRPASAPPGTMPGAGLQPNVYGFGGAAPGNASSVRVYSLGGITNTTKFTEVEATLRDVLKADGVSADAAKLAFHERTNVLVVTADSRVHDLVTQYLEALQKNVAAAMAEEKRSGGDRREAVEALIRLDAERDQRERVTKQLSETEDMLRAAQRELDRLKGAGPKSQ